MAKITLTLGGTEHQTYKRCEINAVRRDGAHVLVISHRLITVSLGLDDREAAYLSSMLSRPAGALEIRGILPLDTEDL